MLARSPEDVARHQALGWKTRRLATGVWFHSEESKAKMSATRPNMSDETKKKLSVASLLRRANERAAGITKLTANGLAGHKKG